MESIPVSQMLSPNLITVFADMEIQEVLSIMQEQKTSCVVQIDDFHQPTGVFTEHSLIHFLAQSQSALTGCISDYSHPATIISGKLSCNEAFRILSEKRERQLIVVDEQQKLLGMVEENDFIHHMNYIPMVMQIRIRDVMSSSVHQLAPNDSVQDALLLMNTAIISCVVITEHNTPVGIITERDFVRLANQIEDPAQTPLRDVMHHPVFTLTEDVFVKDASYLMDAKGIRRFVVVDQEGQLSGIVTLRDITKALQKGYVNHLEEELTIKERKILQIESQLKQVNEKTLLSSLMNQVNDGVFIVQADTLEIMEVNQTACHSLGYQVDDLIGLSLKEISSAAAELNQQEVLATLKQEGHMMIRSSYRHRDGSELPVESSVTHLELADHHYIISVVRDLRERLKAEAALLESEETYRSVINTSLDGFWMIDHQGNIEDVNPTYCQMSGYSREELLEMSIPELNLHETREDTLQRIQYLRTAGSAQFLSQHRRKDGSVMDVEVKVSYWPKHGGRFFAYLRDITEYNKDQLRLKQAAAVFENTREAVMVVSANRRIQMVNKAFVQMTGFSEERIIGRSPALLQSGEHPKSFYKAMWHTIRTQGHWQGELISRRADGSTYPELLNISVVRNPKGEISHYVGVFADLSQQKESENRLAYLDYHDPLTGLANRKTLIMRMDHAIRQAQRDHTQVALMLLDLDRFQNVNDSYGHDAGDELLKRVAQELDQSVPNIDTLCRLGGDEFALLFDHLEDIDQLPLIATRVISLLNRPWKLSQGKKVTVGASLGISLSPQNGMDAHTLLQHADAALYQAKMEGRSRFCFFSDELTRNARHRLELETRMHQALENNELEVYFQPQVNILSNEIIGAEALVRWQDPEHGLQSPAYFIDHCEKNGQISEIGRQVLLKTCQQGRQWLDEGLPINTLAVNLSANQLANPNLYQQVSEILQQTGFPARHLELELTESALMTDTESTIELLEQLRGMGIQLAIDDFGTGYSSFTYLKRFPIDILKIDKSFIDEIEYKEEDKEIVAAMIAMGHALGLKVLAEGVENQQQLTILKTLGCDIFQGYLRSRPLPAGRFKHLWQVPEEMMK